MNVGRGGDEQKQTELFAFMHVAEPFKDETQLEANICWQSEMSAKRSFHLSLSQWVVDPVVPPPPFLCCHVLACGPLSGFHAKIKLGLVLLCKQ